jgi:hypothetical protein
MKRLFRKFKVCYKILKSEEYFVMSRNSTTLTTITNCSRGMIEKVFTMAIIELEDLIDQDIAVESVNEILNQK